MVDVLNRHELIDAYRHPEVLHPGESLDVNPNTDAVVILGNVDPAKNEFRIQAAWEVYKLIISNRKNKSIRELTMEDYADGPLFIMDGSTDEIAGFHTWLKEQKGKDPTFPSLLRTATLENLPNPNNGGKTDTKTNMDALRRHSNLLRHVTIVTSQNHAVRTDITAQQHLGEMHFQVIGAVNRQDSIFSIRREVRIMENYTRKHSAETAQTAPKTDPKVA